MRAAVFHRYGPPEVVHVTDVPTPIPGDHEIRIRVRATTVTSGDRRVRSLDVPTGFRLITRLMFGIMGPRQPILGTEVAGVVDAVGTAVSRFQVGDEVVASRGAEMGGHAEFVCIAEDGAVAAKPSNLGFDEAAALSFGGATALHFFREGTLADGERVLVNGASGAVGTAAVQLAHHLGAAVTGVCSRPNAELVRSLGADDVVDYTTTDVTGLGATWDVVVDTVGNLPYARSRRILADGGRLLAVVSDLPRMLRAPWVAMTTRHRVVTGVATVRPEDVERLAELAQTGAFRPVVDRRYPLEDIVEAHRHVDSGHTRGSVVVTIADAG